MATASNFIQIQNYRLDFPHIGKGAFGIVYRGRDNHTGETIAAKNVQYKEQTETLNEDNEDLYKMNRKEGEILHKLNGHKNIVKLIDFFDADSCHWFIMEFCELGDLPKYMKTQAVNLHDKIKIMVDVSSGLSFMHSMKPPVIHRDIKPENVLMKLEDGEHRAKISDFGLGKLFEADTSHFTMMSGVGTWGFMAPEFFIDTGYVQYQPGVDTFALGLLYSVVLLYDKQKGSGMTPMSVESRKSAMHIHYGLEMKNAYKDKAPMPELFEQNSEVDQCVRQLQGVIMQMTQFHDRDRPCLQQVKIQIKDIYSHSQLQRDFHIMQREFEKLRRDHRQLQIENKIKQQLLDIQPKPLSECLSTLSLDEKYTMVAAIDLGRTSSAYAFSFRGDKKNIRMNKNWGANLGFQGYKTPTSVMLDSANKFAAFGYEAEERYANAEEENGPNSYQLYRNFSAILCGSEKLTKYKTIPSVDGEMTSALDIFTMALGYFKDHLIQSLSDQMYVGAIEMETIRWVIPVPVILTENAKHFIKEAAYKAGLTQNKASTQLLIVTEPEASSVYCHSLDVNQFIQVSGEQSLPSFPAGDKYMVIDAGGDTVDFTVFEVLRSGKMKTIQTTSEGAGGGSQVDQNFVQLLNKILGRHFIQLFQQKWSQQWLCFMVNFERVKRSARPDHAHNSGIQMPYVMGVKYQEICGKDIDKSINQLGKSEVSFSNGWIVVEHEAVVSLFQPVIHSILSHIDSLLRESAMSGVSCLMLVGGFAKCAFLQKAITDRFSSRVRVLVPEDAQLAVVKGAVLCGHTPDHFWD